MRSPSKEGNLAPQLTAKVARKKGTAWEGNAAEATQNTAIKIGTEENEPPRNQYHPVEYPRHK